MPMIRLAAFASLVGLFAAPLMAGAQAATPDASITRINATPARDGWFVCDNVSGATALFAGMQGDKGASVITLLDRRTGTFDTQTYQVGPGDAGAGQVHWSLSQGGKPVGFVHGVNPGMLGDGHAATTPTIMGVQIGAMSIDCRWLAHTRFIGVDSRRSITVVETPQGLVYQSFDFAKRGPVVRSSGGEQSSKPTLRIAGGSEVVGTRSGFRFVNDGYVYVVQRPRASEPATVVVTRGGRVIHSETLVGFTYAPPSGVAPEKTSAALGPEAVWSGAGLEACRARTGAQAVDDCLVEQMRKGGASAGSIAFTQRLIVADSPGYVAGWRQAGPVGIATVAYPFRANTNEGSWLVPASGDPIDVDAYQLTAGDKGRADYKAMLADNPDVFPVPPGDVTLGKTPAGNLRVLVTTPTASCHACAPAASIVVGYDFDAAGHFLFAGVVAVA
jgi:hypothetical protein